MFSGSGDYHLPACGPGPESALVGLTGGDYPLLVIVGPTAAGKSALALALAERLGGEIINCDSVQVYRGFDIGTGKVPPEERQGVPHHLLDLVEPEEDFTAGDFRREAEGALAAVRARGNLPIVVGGTGLYLRALLLGLFDGPPRSTELRARLKGLAHRRGREFLHRLLGRLDPPAAARIHFRDTQKIIRAIEVCVLAHQPVSAMQAQGRSGLRGFRVIKIGLAPERAQLAERINARVSRMFERGLLEETRAALARSPAARRLKPLGALGYRQACAGLREEISLEEAIRSTQAATRQYAKRQMTWFRREPDVTWFAGFGDDAVVQGRVFDWLSTAWPAVTDAAQKHPSLLDSSRTSNEKDL
jgi:tRNA dimethylallyltransferase